MAGDRPGRGCPHGRHRRGLAVERGELDFARLAAGNFSAYAPDLPDVVAAGDSVEETEQLMREAIVLCLEELQAAGEPIPKPSSVARTVEVVA